MAEVANKFIERAPRYVLRASDNKFLRFAPDGDRQNIYTTRLVNISITGLAFVCLKEQAPKIGEIVKMEFPVPGGKQIAWWGNVIRIENYRRPKSWQKDKEDNFQIQECLIAVNFEKLPEGHSTSIHQGLRTKAMEIARQRRFHFQGQWVDFIKTHWQQVVLFVFAIIFTFLVLFLLSQPMGKYTAERGAPWGQRF